MGKSSSGGRGGAAAQQEHRVRTDVPAHSTRMGRIARLVGALGVLLGAFHGSAARAEPVVTKLLLVADMDDDDADGIPDAQAARPAGAALTDLRVLPGLPRQAQLT